MLLRPGCLWPWPCRTAPRSPRFLPLRLARPGRGRTPCSRAATSMGQRCQRAPSGFARDDGRIALQPWPAGRGLRHACVPSPRIAGSSQATRCHPSRSPSIEAFSGAPLSRQEAADRRTPSRSTDGRQLHARPADADFPQSARESAARAERSLLEEGGHPSSRAAHVGRSQRRQRRPATGPQEART